jgi:hypothetical protein
MLLMQPLQPFKSQSAYQPQQLQSMQAFMPAPGLQPGSVVTPIVQLHQNPSMCPVAQIQVLPRLTAYHIRRLILRW